MSLIGFDVLEIEPDRRKSYGLQKLLMIRSEITGSPENADGILMRWPWRREARPIEPRRAVSTRVMELETAKEILAEVFGARPGEVEESGPEEREEGQWPERVPIELLFLKIRDSLIG